MDVFTRGIEGKIGRRISFLNLDRFKIYLISEKWTFIEFYKVKYWRMYKNVFHYPNTSIG